MGTCRKRAGTAELMKWYALAQVGDGGFTL
jgi:hypothetical protein